jgi:predicted Zn-dependent protease
MIDLVKELEPPDIHHFTAAEGWLGLSNAQEAQADLDKISKANRSHLAVMELQWHVHARAKNWKSAVQSARAITKKHSRAPFGWIHLAFALHELKRTQEAYESLVPILDKFPKEWLMRYNMACYAVQLGNLDEGWNWLVSARKVGDKTEIDELLATDPDLEPLRKDAQRT